MQLHSTVFLLVRFLGEIWLVLLLTRILPHVISTLRRRPDGSGRHRPYSHAGK